MSQRLMAGIRHDLVRHFSAHMASKLEVIQQEFEASFADGLELEPPAVYAYGRRTLKDAAFPRLEVLAGSTGIDFYTQNATDATHQVEIRIALKGHDPGRLSLALDAYVVAIWELLVERFFQTTGDDYFALHGEGAISVEYEGQTTEQLMNAGPYFDSAVFTIGFSKQEEW